MKKKKRKPKTYVIFRACYGSIDEPCETKKELLETLTGLKNAIVYREEYRKNYVNKKWVGVSLINKQHLSKYSK